MGNIDKIKKGYVFRQFKDMYLLIPLHQAPLNPIKLNLYGALIWKLLQDGLNEAEIVSLLAQHYHKDEAFFSKLFQEFLGYFDNNGSVTSRLNSGVKDVPLIRRAMLELTGQCNLNCFHCYAKGKRTLKDMSTNKIIELIDEMVEEDTLFLSLTGGEVFSRKDFVKIYEHIRLKGLIPSMISNTTLLNDEILNILIKYPPAHIKVSLYGASPKTHEFVTRVKGSFYKTIKAVKQLKKAGINVFFGSTLFKETAHDMDNMKKLAHEMGVMITFGNSLIPTLEKDRSFFVHKASDAVGEKADAHNKSLTQNFVGEAKRPAFKKSGEIYDCVNGLINYAISSDGSLILCQTDNNREIKLKDVSLKQGLQKLKEAREQRLKIPEGCKSCPLIYNLNCI